MITAYLKNCASWIEKLELLILLFEAVVQSNSTSSDRFVHCDTFLGDIMRSRAALDELLGEVRTLGDRLIDVVSLYRCDDELVARSKKTELLRKLFEISGKADLKATRAAFVYHIYAGLGARTDMASSDPLQEMQALGRVREKLRHDDSYVGAQKTRRLLEQRIGRRVSAQSVGDHVKEIPEVGAQIRVALATYRLIPFVDQKGPVLDRLTLIFEDPMLAEKLAKEASKAVDHLADTAALHRAINGSQLPEHLRRKYKDKLALMQQAFVRSTRFFATMEQAIEQAPQRIVVLLEICGGKAFVEKDMQQRAEDAVVQAVSAPQFVPSYLAGSRSPEERAKTLDVLRGKLRDAGFDPNTMLQAA